MDVRVLKANEARTRWRDVVDAVSKGDTEIVVERYGKPVVAVISYQDYVALREQLEELRLVREASAAYDAWKLDTSLGRPWRDVEAGLVADGLLDE